MPIKTIFPFYYHSNIGEIKSLIFFTKGSKDSKENTQEVYYNYKQKAQAAEKT